jgi:hypothetical protein
VIYRPNANTAVLYIHKNIYGACIQKWDWYRRPRKEEKKERK